MEKPEIYTRLDVIAGKIQNLDYLHSWTEAQLAEYESLAAEWDELNAMLKEVAA